MVPKKLAENRIRNAIKARVWKSGEVGSHWMSSL
jgi:hypothetical protein